MLTFETWPIDRLIEYARNPRKNDHAVDRVAAAIKEYGFRVPVIAKSDGLVVDGHLRLKAAKKLGLKEIPVILADDMTDAQIKAFRLSVNKVAEYAEWDIDLLKVELGELQGLNFDLALTGFNPDEIGAFLADKTEGLTDPDEVPEAPARAVSALGDTWILGKHRLRCGDSTSMDAVDKLIEAQAPDMVFTDPPYGIAHSGKGIDGADSGNDFGEIMGDQDVTVAIDAFRLCAGQWPEARMIFWGANYYPSVLPDGHGWLVWDKQREGDTFSGAELAFINGGVRVDVFRHMWHGMVKASEHGQKRVHPTQKPTALAEWCFERYGDPKLVLDLFGGSGSTLIACEKTGRLARVMELDAKFCDVAIKRWQDFTGQNAILEATGRTYEEMASDRYSAAADGEGSYAAAIAAKREELEKAE